MAIEGRTSLLALDWKTINWYDSLWLFELEGIKASGYPGVFGAGNATEFCTPAKFVEFASRATASALECDQAAWCAAWRAAPISNIELDPRYVAFRTIHDWIILCARVLAERPVSPEDLELESFSEVGSSCEGAPRSLPQPIRTEDERGVEGAAAEAEQPDADCAAGERGGQQSAHRRPGVVHAYGAGRGRYGFGVSRGAEDAEGGRRASGLIAEPAMAPWGAVAGFLPVSAGQAAG